MDIAILIVVVLTLIVAVGNFALGALEFRSSHFHGDAEPKPETAAAIAAAPQKYAEPTTEALKIVGDHPQPPFPAPKVGEETLMQWMIRSYNSDGIWARFVDHFYARAASHHKVRPLFEGKDLADIKRKFLATLLIMCDKGVNERAAATLVELHLHLNMSVETYDATMEALEFTLLEFHVPEETIAQFVPMINYFRDEMTVA